ncbi:MAG TPA: GNAT family N-acetyltransferase [Nitrolancea sp.]|nr:GNAT family N-acetyltransferase [Nitrolancea sp.]
MIIRKGRVCDAARLRELGVLGWETTYAGFLRPENRRAYLNGPYWSVERLAAVIEADDCATLVAEIAGSIVGFLMLEPHPSGNIELTRFYVDPSVRGQGIGGALWQAALAHPSAADGRAILVNVFGDNRDGRRFYERLGFDLIEETTTNVGDQTVYDVWYRLPSLR